eukprot:gene6014-5308_t
MTASPPPPAETDQPGDYCNSPPPAETDQGARVILAKVIPPARLETIRPVWMTFKSPRQAETYRPGPVDDLQVTPARLRHIRPGWMTASHPQPCWSISGPVDDLSSHPASCRQIRPGWMTCKSPPPGGRQIGPGDDFSHPRQAETDRPAGDRSGPVDDLQVTPARLETFSPWLTASHPLQAGDRSCRWMTSVTPPAETDQARAGDRIKPGWMNLQSHPRPGCRQISPGYDVQVTPASLEQIGPVDDLQVTHRQLGNRSGRAETIRHGDDLQVPPRQAGTAQARVDTFKHPPAGTDQARVDAFNSPPAMLETDQPGG